MSRRLNRTFKLIVAVLACCCVLGCRFAAESDLAGKYKTSTPWGEATLDLNEDGTLSESVSVNDGPTYSLTGTWVFDNDGLRRRPCFDIRYDGLGEKQRSYCRIGPAVYFGLVVIDLDPDAGISYRRQD